MNTNIHIGPAGDNFDSGFRGIRAIREHKRYRARHAAHERMLSEYANGTHISLALARLKETHSTSDFPLMMADTLDRRLLGRYRAVPTTWRMIAAQRNARDFRIAKDFFIDGGNNELPRVKELAPYPEVSLTEGKYEFQVFKRGQRLPLSMELVVNDDLGAFNTVADRFGEGAARTEDRVVTRLYAGNLTFFSNGNKNLINTTQGASTDNPALSLAALAQAFKVISKAVDAQGQPIIIDGFVLEVPPSLMDIAQTIMGAQTFRTTAAAFGGASTVELEVGNWVRSRIKKVVENPYLPILDPTTGDTAWYLFADSQGGRTALQAGYLAGHEGPEILMKAPNQMAIGGGLMDVFQGDFDNDSIDYKVRLFFGASLQDPKLAYMSKGTGAP